MNSSVLLHPTMCKREYLFLLLFIAICHADKPCEKVKTDDGYICACNSTYCDTISTLPKLPPTQFHLYTTSKIRPGFNHETGYFRVEAFPSNGTMFEVNITKTFQKIRGFGGAFTDAFGYVFNSLSFKSQENLIRSYFSEEGTEYTMCRVVLGTCDFSLKDYNYAPYYDPSLQSFNLTEDDYIYKIAQIKRALQTTKRSIQFVGSTWSAPKWMRTSNATGATYIKKEFRQAWADYHAKSVIAFQNEGLQFWSISTGNEPIMIYILRHIFPKIQTVVMFPEEQREWVINNLGPAFRSRNLNTSIILLDDMRYLTTWWMNTVLHNTKAKDYVSGIGLHWYFDGIIPPSNLDDMLRKHPGQEIVYTESSYNSPDKKLFPKINQKTREEDLIQNVTQKHVPALGSWKRGGRYAANIIQNLNHKVTTYIDWNLALDINGGPNRNGVFCDSAILVNKTADEFYKQPMFYAVGHFSKFILPGSLIVSLKQVESSTGQASDILQRVHEEKSSQPTSNIDDKIHYVGALNPDGSRSLVFYNPMSLPVEIRIHDPERGYAILILEANSLNTVIYW